MAAPNSTINPPSNSRPWLSPGAGDTYPYNRQSETLHIFVCLSTGLALYNVCELFFMVLFTFKTWSGLYFWSLLIGGLGIVPYQLSFFAKYMYDLRGGVKWFDIFLITIGWWTMITAQSLVLWSRLNVIMKGAKGERVIQYTKWMIIINSMCLFPITTICTIGANGGYGAAVTPTIQKIFNVVEKIQMCGFFLQEVTLSSIYIVETARLFGTSLQHGRRKTMRQLIGVNAAIILLDLAILGSEAASLYIFEATFKGLVYSVKLKLEYAILGRLVYFVGGATPPKDEERKTSTGFVDTGMASGPDGGMNVGEFVDLERLATSSTSPSYISHPSAVYASRRKIPRPYPAGEHFDVEFEREMQHFEHAEVVSSLPGNACSDSSDSTASGDTRERLKNGEKCSACTCSHNT